MGERKGQNKYYPPDFDPAKHNNLNAYHGVHALRERGTKAHMGIIIIRFEMPFNVWCEGCGKHIARAVRFNAEKKKVGNYYTTPIWEFDMKCPLCEQHFIVRTDPQHFDYECVSGLRRQERRYEAKVEDDILQTTAKDTAVKLATDSMFRLEHGVDDKQGTEGMAPVLEQLEAQRKDRWRDDYRSNQMLRGLFRTRKKVEQEQAASDASYKQRCGISIDLITETPEDRKLAGLIAQHATRRTIQENEALRKSEFETGSIFDRPSVVANATPSTSSGSSSSASSARDEGGRRDIRSEIKSQVAAKRMADDLRTQRAKYAKIIKPKTDASSSKADTEFVPTKTETSSSKPITDSSRTIETAASVQNTSVNDCDNIAAALVADYSSDSSAND